MIQTTLFLADDHQLFRSGLRMMLEKMKDVQVVGEADNGLSALEGIRETSPMLALIDLSMPGMNGIELIRRIKEGDCDTRTIILSMHSERHFVLESLRAGADGYLLKDAGFDELVRVIREVMAGRKAVSAGLSNMLVDEVVNPGQEEAGAWRVLSARERQVLQLMAEGCSTRETADTLAVSVKTIESHRKQIMDKLGLRSVAELTKYAIREGLTQL